MGKGNRKLGKNRRDGKTGSLGSFQAAMGARKLWEGAWAQQEGLPVAINRVPLNVGPNVISGAQLWTEANALPWGAIHIGALMRRRG